ncbi:MAG: hypothetical protein HRT74_14000, partial [Flavobacteriales bacterium]|nr:hypothetical protein [Flavobacteriales bacterium]
MKLETTAFYKRFHEIVDPDSTRFYRGNIEDSNGDFGELTRGEYLPESLVITHSEGGKEPKDLFWNSVNDPFCVSDRVKNLMEENMITGVQYIPASVYNKKQKQNPSKYYAVVITGRVDCVDYLNSEIRFIKEPWAVKEMAYFMGKKFDVESWDSSDFFMER